jgi:hypothetical protein
LDADPVTVDGSRAPSVQSSESKNELPSESWDGQEDAIEKVEMLALERQAVRVRSKWDALDQKFGEFSAKMENLLTDEAGKCLAGNVVLIDRYLALQDEQRPTEDEITDFRDQLDALLPPLESFDTSSELNPNWVSSIDDVEQQILKATQIYEEALESLEVLIVRGKSISPSSSTLEEAIAQRKVELAEERLKKTYDAAKQAREAKTKELTRLAVEAEELELDGLIAEVERAVEEAKRKRDYERLRQEALSPQVLSLLRPLTDLAYEQPRQITGGMATGEKTADKKPVSLRRLRELGVLDTSERGMIRVALLNSWGWTTRTRWPMKYEAAEPNLWSEKQSEMIRRTQQFLIKYGDVLVKEGILAP